MKKRTTVLLTGLAMTLLPMAASRCTGRVR